MSVNLTFEPDSYRVHNIQDIHTQKDETKRDAIYAAANAFLNDEGILDQGMMVDPIAIGFLGKEGYLAGYTTSPIIISRSYVWVPDVTARCR